MPELKASGLLETFFGTKGSVYALPWHFRWYTSTDLGLILAYWLKTAVPLAFVLAELPRRSLVGWKVGENKMESRIQRGDLHPSHKIAPGMDETSM